MEHAVNRAALVLGLGEPVHVRMVREILAGAGLGTLGVIASAGLRNCPPALLT